MWAQGCCFVVWQSIFKISSVQQNNCPTSKVQSSNIYKMRNQKHLRKQCMMCEDLYTWRVRRRMMYVTSIKAIRAAEKGRWILLMCNCLDETCMRSRTLQVNLLILHHLYHGLARLPKIGCVRMCSVLFQLAVILQTVYVVQMLRPHLGNGIWMNNCSGTAMSGSAHTSPCMASTANQAMRLKVLYHY